MRKNLGPGEYFGSVARRVILDPGSPRNAPAHASHSYVLSEVNHKNAWEVPPHGHVRPYFSFLLSGAYRERAAGFSLEYQPFHLVYHPRQFEHADEIGDGGARFFTIEIPEADSGVFERNPPRAGADRMGGRAVWLASSLYRAFLDAPDSEMAMSCLTAELEAEVTRLPALAEEITPRWLSRVADRIHCEFRDKLRLEDLAREAGVHPVHLSRTFARRRGMGLHDYIEGVRVRWVCGEMAKHEVDLATLAADAGYADQSHMTRAFKRVTGMTPGEMRSAVRKSRSFEGHAVPGFQWNLGTLSHRHA
ncbi:MAG: AraC family transcriptional regulator [Bryobacteraceae bacterium]